MNVEDSLLTVPGPPAECVGAEVGWRSNCFRPFY